MNIRLGNRKDLNGVRRIWEYCFRGDSKEYVDFYFTRKYNPLNTLVYEDRNKITSSIHLNNHVLNMYGKDVNTQYVVGVSTLPEARGAGIMSSMMKESLYEMRNRGNSFSILMPIDFRLYRKFGYENCYDILEHSFDIFQLKNMKLTGEFKEADIESSADLKYIYENFAKRFNGVAVRDEKYFTEFVEEMSSDGGYIYINYTDSKPSGYLAYYISDSDSTMQIREFIYNSIDVYESMLKFIFNHNTQVSSVNMSTPVSDFLADILPNPRELKTVRKSFMMARILDFEKFLKSTGIKGKNISGFEEISIYLEDSIISENHGLYKILNENGNISIRKSNEGKFDLKLKVGDLTQLMFGYKSIEEIEFKNNLNHQIVEKYNKVFAKYDKENFIIEYV